MVIVTLLKKMCCVSYNLPHYNRLGRANVKFTGVGNLLDRIKTSRIPYELVWEICSENMVYVIIYGK